MRLKFLLLISSHRNFLPKGRPYIGRKKMTGYVRVRTNIQISKTSAGKSLSKVYPHYQQRYRQNTAWAINPVPYRADNFGHKMRVDQNEKLEMHLVTRVAAKDGHCYFVVGYATMRMKNNLIVFEDVCRYVWFLFICSSLWIFS